MALPEQPRDINPEDFIVIVRSTRTGAVFNASIHDTFDMARDEAIPLAKKYPDCEVGIFNVVQTWRAIAHITIEEDQAS